MPDSAGKIRGISVPSVPWHEEKQPKMFTKRGDLDKLLHHPWRELHDDAVRDADKAANATQNGPL